MPEDRGEFTTIQDAQTTGNGDEYDRRASKRIKFLIRFSTGVTAGAVQVEEAATAGYTGAWAAHGSPVSFVADAEFQAEVQGPVGVMRARISTTIVGGTVTVRARGQA